MYGASQSRVMNGTGYSRFMGGTKQALLRGLVSAASRFFNGNDTVFLTHSRFQIEAPEGFSARLTGPAHTNPGLAGRSTNLLVSIIAFIGLLYPFRPRPASALNPPKITASLPLRVLNTGALNFCLFCPSINPRPSGIKQTYPTR